MKGLIIFSLITLFTGNPLLALAVIVIIYFFIDRRFIGLLPDFAASWRRRMRISELERIVRANPHNGDALLELGVHYFERGKFRNAVDVLEKAYSKMKDWPDVHFYLGASLYETGHRAKGLMEIQKAVDMNPKISRGMPYIYLIRSVLDNREGGSTETWEACLLRSGSVHSFFQAGKLFRRYGQKKGAEKFFLEVLENYRMSSPTFRRTYRRMAFLSKIYLKYL